MKTIKEKSAKIVQKVMSLFLSGKNEEAIATMHAPAQNNQSIDEDGKRYSELDALLIVDAARRQAALDAKAEARWDFEEKAQNEQAAMRRSELDAWFTRKRASGEIPGAWEKLGLLEFMQSLDGAALFEFSEGGAAMTPVKWMQGFLEEVKKLVDVPKIDLADK